MTDDELRRAIAEAIHAGFDALSEGIQQMYLADADRILAIPYLAEALAQKRYAERMMGHSTGER